MVISVVDCQFFVTTNEIVLLVYQFPLSTRTSTSVGATVVNLFIFTIKLCLINIFRVSRCISHLAGVEMRSQCLEMDEKTLRNEVGRNLWAFR